MAQKTVFHKKVSKKWHKVANTNYLLHNLPAIEYTCITVHGIYKKK